MTDKQLRKLTRKELLEMLLTQGKELQTLQEKYAEAEAALRDRRIRLEHAGSIAEAALQISGIFDAAQNACQQYTESIIQLAQEQTELHSRAQAEAQECAERILAEAKQQCADMIQQTQAQCAAMLKQAEIESGKVNPDCAQAAPISSENPTERSPAVVG